MNFERVRRILSDDPLLPKEVHLDDGRTFRVDSVEQWAATAFDLIVASRRDSTYFPLRKIASIRVLAPRNGKRRRAR